VEGTKSSLDFAFRRDLGGMMSFGIVGALVGVVLGILVASEFGKQRGGQLKDGGLRRQVVSNRASETSIPGGALLGASVGLVIGFLRNRIVPRGAEESRSAAMGLMAGRVRKHVRDWILLAAGIGLVVALAPWLLRPLVERDWDSRSRISPKVDELFARIERGMTDEEVRAVLGGAERGSLSRTRGALIQAPAGAEYEYYWWITEGGRPCRISVFFDNDVRVVDKDLIPADDYGLEAKDKR
jgi:hypothetical protein